MPEQYGYPGKDKIMKTVQQGEFSDANESALHREGMEGDLLGSVEAKFSQSVDAPSKSSGSVDASIWRMADDNSIYSS